MYVRECFADVLFKDFYGFVSYIWVFKPFWVCVCVCVCVCLRVCSKFIDFPVAVQLSQHHLLKSLFSIVYSCLLFWKLIDHWCVGSISGLSILFHWSMCLFLYQYHTVLITIYSIVVLSEIQEGYASSFVVWFFFFPPQDWFGNSGSLWFHINFRIISPSSVKNVPGDLRETALNLWIALDSMAALTILICHIQEQGIPFLFVLNHLQFPLSMFCSSQHMSHLLGQVCP